MLSLLPLVVALASAPSPAPSAPAHPTPLTEIGRVRAAPVCTAIVVHANGAITTALDNDRNLAILTTNLRSIDFDRLNDLQRRNAINALMKQAGTIRESAKSADGEIKQLRAYAQAAKEPQRKTELKAFADALGGAIYRQAKAADEFMRDVTILQGRAEVAEARAIENRYNPVPANINARAIYEQRTMIPEPPARLNDVFRQIAGDISDRNQAILVDEGTAADHSIAATSGC